MIELRLTTEGQTYAVYVKDAFSANVLKRFENRNLSPKEFKELVNYIDTFNSIPTDDFIKCCTQFGDIYFRYNEYEYSFNPDTFVIQLYLTDSIPYVPAAPPKPRRVHFGADRYYYHPLSEELESDPDVYDDEL